MNKFVYSLLIGLFFSSYVSAQKPPLDSSVYDGWKSLSAEIISDDGKWVTYVINPQQGDGWFYIYNVTTGQKDSVARGGKAVFSPEQKYLAYQVIPAYNETRQAKKKKLSEDKMPKNNLEIRSLPNNEVTKISRVKSFSVAEKNSYWMAYLMEKKANDKKPARNAVDSTKAGEPATKKTKTPEAKGTELVIYNPVLKKDFKYADVTEYVVAHDGKTISFLQSTSDTTKIENFKVNIFDTQKENTTIISNIIPDLNCLDSGTQCFHLFYYEERKKQSRGLFDTDEGDREHIRRDGVSDFILERAKKQFGKNISKEDIFYYVYGFLHSPEYRTMFANDLKKMLPRLSLVEDVRDFWKFSKAGRELA